MVIKQTDTPPIANETEVIRDGIPQPAARLAAIEINDNVGIKVLNSNTDCLDAFINRSNLVTGAINIVSE